MLRAPLSVSTLPGDGSTLGAPTGIVQPCRKHRTSPSTASGRRSSRWCKSTASAAERTNCSPADAPLFKHPLSLTRLALFLQDALRATKTRERPLVVCGPASRETSDDAKHTVGGGDGAFALVVGVTGAPRADDADGGNHFSSSFRRAAETVRARFKHDAFEASVVQVAERNLG